MVDRQFDGIESTRPNGTLHVVTGAGGKQFYEPGWTDSLALWLHLEDGDVDYVVKIVTDRHSVTVIDIDGRRLTMSQVDESG